MSLTKKNRIIVGISGIAVIWILINFYLFYTKTEKRPDINPEKSEQNVSKEYIYERALSKSEQEIHDELVNKQNLAQNESKLLELLNEKFVWIVKDFQDTENRIKQKLEEEKDNVKTIGWKVRRVDKQTHLVSYTYEKGGKTLGWFFDVKSGGERIRDVSSNPELMEKYNVDYREDVIKELREENNLKPTASKLDRFKSLMKKGNRGMHIENEKRILILKQD